MKESQCLVKIIYRDYVTGRFVSEKYAISHMKSCGREFVPLKS